jgi:hypothetical protein
VVGTKRIDVVVRHGLGLDVPSLDGFTIDNAGNFEGCFRGHLFDGCFEVGSVSRAECVGALLVSRGLSKDF